MMAPEQYDEIVRLLAKGNLSYRRIARLTGVSRTMVSAIASRRRPRYEPSQPSEDDWEQPQGPPVRCRGCGGLVYPPCRLCQIRALKKRLPDRRQRPPNWPD